jgi:hypothetical protein
LVEKKTGLDGSLTFIQLGFLAWCRAGSIFEQDIAYGAKLACAAGKCIRIFRQRRLWQENIPATPDHSPAG